MSLSKQKYPYVFSSSSLSSTRSQFAVDLCDLVCVDDEGEGAGAEGEREDVLDAAGKVERHGVLKWEVPNVERSKRKC